MKNPQSGETLDIAITTTDVQTWTPSRALSDLSSQNTQAEIDALKDGIAILNTTTDSISSDVTALSGTPQQVTGVSAVESPYKTQSGQLVSLVAVDFTPAAGDVYFESVQVWFTGFNGSTTPQLMAEGSASPLQFLCETTHEVVTVTVVAVSASGITADFATAPTTTVALDGVDSAPPAPSIAQSQLALPNDSGWQFGFNVLGGLEADLIDGYWIYHSTSSTTPVPPAKRYQYIRQSATNVGVVTVQEVTSQKLYYWVSAVNIGGMESPLTAVPVTFVDPIDPPSTPAPVSTTTTFQPTTSLNGWGSHVGNYESGGGLGSEVWTTGSASAYTSPDSAIDGNEGTSASAYLAHTHTYAGCIWSFSSYPGLPSGATVTAASVKVLSEARQSSGYAGHVDIWYTLDNGSTWTKLYGTYQPRFKQYDSVTLSPSQNMTQIQVMAFSDSHDDTYHLVYEIRLEVTYTSSTYPDKVNTVSATLVGGNVQISFNRSNRNDVDKYEVWRALHGAAYATSHLMTTITSTGASSYTWTDTTAHDGTYDYYVLAHNASGYSPQSDPAYLGSASSVLYPGGITVTALKPAEVGADVTAGKSIDILADGTTFTRTPYAYNDLHVKGIPMGNQSILLNPTFQDTDKLPARFWSHFGDGTANVDDSTGETRRMLLQVNGGSGTQHAYVNQCGYDNSGGTPWRTFTCTAGQQILMQCMIWPVAIATGVSGSMTFVGWNASGTDVQYVTCAPTTASAWNVCKKIVTVQSDVVKFGIYFEAVTDGSVFNAVYFKEPFVSYTFGNTGSSLLNPQGSINPQAITASGSLTGTLSGGAAAIQFSFTGGTIYCPDGSQYTASSGGWTTTTWAGGTVAYTTAYNGNIVFRMSDESVQIQEFTGSATAATRAASWADGYIPLNYGINITTPSAGGSGGGGGGGSACFSGNTSVTMPYGSITFSEIEWRGGTATISNRFGDFEAILLVHEEAEREMIDMGDGELVTLDHLIWDCEKKRAVPAREYFKDCPRVIYSGKVYNLSVVARNPWEHWYILRNGAIASNMKEAP